MRDRIKGGGRVVLGGWWPRRRAGRPAPSWGIAVLAREPAALVLTHLAWHRAAGAAALHLYLDDPEDPVAGAAAAIEGVRVTRCDAGFWASHPSGRRPGLIVARQTHCATHAYARAGVDWLLHLDADEFLLQTDPLANPLSDELAALADHHGALVVPVRERVYLRPDPVALFEGLFRIPQPPARRGHPLLAPLRDMAPAGVIGHALGKSLTRTGLDVALHPHFPRRRDGGGDGSGSGPGDPPRRPSATAVLLHFDGLTPRHWHAKMRRYGRLVAGGASGFLGPHRRAQLEALAAAGDDPARLTALHDRLRVIADPAPWLDAGLVAAHDFDPAPACRAALGHVPDLSVAGFDAALPATGA